MVKHYAWDDTRHDFVQTNKPAVIEMRIGLDLGQMTDYTVMIVNQINRTNDTHEVQEIVRPQLGTKYPAIIKEVMDLQDRFAAETGKAVALYIDATGLGRPVIDEFVAKGATRITAVTIVQGENVTREGKELHIGKQALVARMNILLESDRISWDGSTELGKVLTTELHRYRIRISKDANALFEAERGFNDDTVTALMLATWKDTTRKLARVF